VSNKKTTIEELSAWRPEVEGRLAEIERRRPSKRFVEFAGVYWSPSEVPRLDSNNIPYCRFCLEANKETPITDIQTDSAGKVTMQCQHHAHEGHPFVIAMARSKYTTAQASAEIRECLKI